jgi:hypothetical protein
MTTARAGLGQYRPAMDRPDQAAGHHHHRASGLFEKDHAYAARLVQTATVIGSVVRSTTTTDRVPSEIEGAHGVTAPIISQSRVQRSGS